jgi:hypothetical protein
MSENFVHRARRKTELGCPGHLPCDHKVITITHPADGFDNLALIIGNDFNPLEVLQFSVRFFLAVCSLGEPLTMPSEKHHLAKYAEFVSTVLPPSTSSPMMRHAAVWMGRMPRSSGESIDILLPVHEAGRRSWIATVGGEMWRATWDSRASI